VDNLRLRGPTRLKQQNKKDKDQNPDDDLFPSYMWFRPISSAIEQRKMVCVLSEEEAQSHVATLDIIKHCSFLLLGREDSFKVLADVLGFLLSLDICINIPISAGCSSDTDLLHSPKIIYRLEIKFQIPMVMFLSLFFDPLSTFLILLQRKNHSSIFNVKLSYTTP
jgi:hypothetical protein